jgi:hypothetical protein
MTFLSEQVGRLVRVAEQKERYRKDVEAAARALIAQIRRLWKAGDAVRFGVESQIAFIKDSIGELNDAQQCQFLIAIDFADPAGLVSNGMFPIAAAVRADGIVMSVREGREHLIQADQSGSFIKLIADLEAVVDAWISGIERNAQLS